MSRDAYLSLMCDDGSLRSDLALTEICAPSKQATVEGMLRDVEEGSDRYIQVNID